VSAAHPAAAADVAEELLPLVRRFATGDYGIALGGAHAKGVDDAHSDVDLYLFAERWLPGPARDQLCRVILGPDTVVRSWGEDGADRNEQGGTDFAQGGTDFGQGGRSVECWLRGVAYVTDIVDGALAGVVSRDFVTWTAMGYFNHCTLSDLQHMVILDDPHGILASWQAQVADYPPALRQAILETHLSAAQFWPDNFHYASAVARGDVLYCSAIAQQVVQNLIQVMFALNETYFPGEKKLAASLDRLPCKPVGFARRLESLIWPGDMPAVEALEAQRAELESLVRDVATLAS
jgi:hypothetical protein